MYTSQPLLGRLGLAAATKIVACKTAANMSTATPSPPYEKLLSLGTKIVAVGRNYAAHAKELGNAVPKVPPLYSLSSFLALKIPFQIPNFNLDNQNRILLICLNYDRFIVYFRVYVFVCVGTHM